MHRRIERIDGRCAVAKIPLPGSEGRSDRIGDVGECNTHRGTTEKRADVKIEVGRRDHSNVTVERNRVGAAVRVGDGKLHGIDTAGRINMARLKLAAGGEIAEVPEAGVDGAEGGKIGEEGRIAEGR